MHRKYGLEDTRNKQVWLLATGFWLWKIFSALESLIFLWFQFLSGLMRQSSSEQSSCQIQKSFLEFQKGLILPILSCHSLFETLKLTKGDCCCSLQTPTKMKTGLLINMSEAVSSGLMLLHHQWVSHKQSIPVSTGCIVVSHAALIPEGEGAWAELECTLGKYTASYFPKWAPGSP